MTFLSFQVLPILHMMFVTYVRRRLAQGMCYCTCPQLHCIEMEPLHFKTLPPICSAAVFWRSERQWLVQDFGCVSLIKLCSVSCLLSCFMSFIGGPCIVGRRQSPPSAQKKDAYVADAVIPGHICSQSSHVCSQSSHICSQSCHIGSQSIHISLRGSSKYAW